VVLIVIPELFRYVFIGLLNLIAPTRSKRRPDKASVTILKISIFEYFLVLNSSKIATTR